MNILSSLFSQFADRMKALALVKQPMERPPIEMPGEDGMTDTEREQAMPQPNDKDICKLIRMQPQDKQTLGWLHGKHGRLATIELAWKDNAKKVSCIPTGRYNVIPRSSQKYRKHFHILDVPNRDYILIHPANYSRQLMGCIAVGLSHTDIDGDGLQDVTSSKRAMQVLLDTYPNGFTLIIV